MASKIRVVSSSILALASSTPHRIELTPWDLQFLQFGPIQKGLLFPKPKPSQLKQLLQPNTTLVEHLKISLSRTLEFFPLLTGRLGAVIHDGHNSSFFIDCNNAGAEFVHATAEDVSVSDVVDSLYIPQIVHCFFTLNGYVNYAGITKPLLGVQVTELVDGYFIGCTMNHVVGDGASFWMLFNAWSEISRGSDGVSKRPCFNRWAPDPVKFPLTISLTSPIEVTKRPSPDLKGRFFHYSKEKILTLKKISNAENTLDVTVSSLQAVLGHLWRAIVRCQGFEDDDYVKFMFMIGARQRLKPAMPEGYFGNAIYSAAVTARVGELKEEGQGFAAGEMNKVIVSQRDEKVRNFYNSWVKDPKLFKLDGVFDRRNMVTSSSPRHDVYGNDFGWGKPLAVRSGGANNISGKITVFPGVEQGSIDVEVCLLGQVLSNLGGDKDFMDFVCFGV